MEFEGLLGKTLTAVDVVSTGEDGAEDKLVFTLESGKKYKLFHCQDCCESVYIEDIVGDLDNLVGSPLMQVEEVSNRDETPEGAELPEWHDDSYTWTFYKMATAKGYVTIRWLGISNGYYSEAVDFGPED